MNPESTTGPTASRPAGAILLGLRLALSHHPLCTAYSADVARMAGLHVCAGCLATWPAFAAALPLALWARLEGAAAIGLLVVGVALAAPQMTGYLRRRRSRAERAAAKALGGAGLATALVGALTGGWGLGAAAALIGLGVAVTLGLQLVRMRGILRTCDACPYRRDWDACPGFAGLGPPLQGAPTALGTGPGAGPRPADA